MLASNLTLQPTPSSCVQAVQAVTWGVFPGKEVQQPTIVDNETFSIWKDEAFALWLTQWGCIYDDESESADLLHSIHDSFYLIYIIDNNFIRYGHP